MSTKNNKSESEENPFAELIAQCAEDRPANFKLLEALPLFWQYIKNPTALNHAALLLDISLRIKAKKPDITPKQLAAYFYQGGKFAGMGWGNQCHKKLSNWYPVGESRESIDLDDDDLEACF